MNGIVFILKVHPAEVREEATKTFELKSLPWWSTRDYGLLNLRAQQNYANDVLRSRGHLLLNDVYDMLSLPRTKLGMIVGWTTSSLVDFNPVVNGDKTVSFTFNVDGVIYDFV